MYVMKQLAHCRNVYCNLWPGCTRPSSGNSWKRSEEVSHCLSSSAVGSQKGISSLKLIDVLPVGYYVDQVFGKNRQTGTDVHLLGWFVLVQMNFKNTGPRFFEAGL